MKYVVVTALCLLIGFWLRSIIGHHRQRRDQQLGQALKNLGTSNVPGDDNVGLFGERWDN